MTVVIDCQTVKRTSGSIMAQQSVYASDRNAITGYCLYLGGMFDVDRQGDMWIERHGTLRPILHHVPNKQEKAILKELTP